MAEPLRVLTCLHSLQAGGVERDVLRFTKAWRNHGIDARIALGRWQGELIAEAPDVPYLRLPGEHMTARNETWRMIAGLPVIIRRFRPEVLLLASNNHAIIGLAMQLLLGRRCPPIVLRVSMDLIRADTHAWVDRIDRWIFRLYSGIFVRVVAMSPQLNAQIVEHMALAPRKVVTIMNGSTTEADLQRIVTLCALAGKDRRPGRDFLGVGRLLPQKNFILLIEAFARIARPEDRLTIVGEGDERARIEARVSELGIQDQVVLPGHETDVAPRFASANIFVLSSDFEGLPAVVVEALAAGLPIVATRCAASLPVLLADAGSLVPVRDVAALASTMDSVLNNPIDNGAMRARAAQFTTEATTGQWISLFHELAQVPRVDHLARTARASSMDDLRTFER